MGKVEILMPKMGESVAEATIIKWLKNEGDSIEADEAVLEIATDKVDSEIPSPENGILVQQLFKENDVVKVGDVIAVMEVAGKDSQKNPAAAENNTKEKIVENTVEVSPSQITESASSEIIAPVTQNNGSIPRSSAGKFYSPLVRSIAEKEAIGIDELNAIKGSGLNDRVTKHDVLNFLKNRSGDSVAAPTIQKTQASSVQSQVKPENVKAVSLMEGDEIVEMDRMRKLIADHMVMSKHTSPHVTSMIEIDVTNIVNWRNKVKDAFEKREGEKLTFTPIFFEQIAKAIKEMPGINISVEGNKIIKRKHINMGMATALPSGNLIVPVIKDADRLNLLGLTKAVNDLANRARNNKLSPDEIQDGTFTVTNVGTFGNVMGTPIINQPQVAVVALGAIRKKPAVIETPFGDTIGIRQMMFISMSYDHRVVDGSLGGSFIKRLADLIEAFDTKREI